MKNARWVAALGCLVGVVLASVVSAAGPFRGNTKTYVFHQESCRYYSCPNCTAKFATAREAVDRGYRACGVCQPGTAGRENSHARDAAFVGNTNSHKFHRNSCRYAGCSNCTAKFDSRDEAIDAGYAPGGCCKP